MSIKEIVEHDEWFQNGIQLLKRLQVLHPKVVKFISGAETFKVFEVNRHFLKEYNTRDRDDLVLILDILGFRVKKVGDYGFKVLRNDEDLI